MAVKLQFRRDTAANWESENPILSEGELGLDTTNQRFKIGNGTDTWNAIDNAQYTNKAETFLATTTLVGSNGSSDWSQETSGTWEGVYTTTKTVNGIITTDTPLIEIDLSSATVSTYLNQLTNYNLIFRVEVSANNQVKFYAQQEPTLSLPIIVKVVR
jgi:hypothetical protein